MTQVRRRPIHKQSSPYGLARTIVILAALLAVACFLFQLDAFPRQRPRRSVTKKSLINPEQLIATNNNNDNNNNNNNNNAQLVVPPPPGLRQRSDRAAGTNGDEALQQQQQQQQQQQVQPPSHDDKGRTDDQRGDEGANHQDFGVGGAIMSHRRRYRMELANLKSITIQDGVSSTTTSGTVIIETRDDWAPLGVERFHDLIQHEFFDNARFFRVVPDFIVQFGIAADPRNQDVWKTKAILDDPVVVSNTRGTVTFAMAGPNTRTTQLFINTRTAGNQFLDKQGFAPIAEVLSGMEFVDMINDEYREKPNQGKIVNRGNDYLQEQFPHLSYVVSIREITDSSELAVQ